MPRAEPRAALPRYGGSLSGWATKGRRGGGEGEALRDALRRPGWYSGDQPYIYICLYSTH